MEVVLIDENVEVRCGGSGCEELWGTVRSMSSDGGDVCGDFGVKSV